MWWLGGCGELGNAEDTLVFLDEIQQYPQFLTMLKFLRQDGRYRYIASGSLLGVTLRSTTSIPIGSILRKKMYQLDFEEFLIANGVVKMPFLLCAKHVRPVKASERRYMK